MMKSEEVLAYEDCVIFISTAAAAIVLQHDTICTCKVYVFVSCSVGLYSVTNILVWLAYKYMVLGLLNFDRHLKFR